MWYFVSKINCALAMKTDWLPTGYKCLMAQLLVLVSCQQDYTGNTQSSDVKMVWLEEFNVGAVNCWFYEHASLLGEAKDDTGQDVDYILPLWVMGYPSKCMYLVYVCVCVCVWESQIHYVAEVRIWLISIADLKRFNEYCKLNVAVTIPQHIELTGFASPEICEFSLSS